MNLPSSPLSRRLEALRQGGSSGRGRPPSPGGKFPLPEKPSPFLPGWKEEDFLLYRRTLTVAVPPLPLPAESRLLKRSRPGIPWEGFGRDCYRFFDLETTGLSGGTGNIAFLAGVGKFEEGNFRVTQIFLADYPGEPNFLTLLAKLLPPESVWVSYNGRAFDTSLLRTRFLMNRRVLKEGIPLDLLHPARRLWRRLLPDCSLGTLERKILHRERGMDIPGEKIPERYFAYLKDRQPDPLEPVIAHHLEDITSLARLFPLMEAILAGKEPSVPRDPLGVGTILLPLAPEAAADALRRGAEAGDLRCSLVLGAHLKRTGRAEEACALWNALWHSRRSHRAARELAIHWEHHRKEPARALEIVEAVLEDLPSLSGHWRKDWKHRRRRLIRKAGFSGGRSPGAPRVL